MPSKYIIKYKAYKTQDGYIKDVYTPMYYKSTGFFKGYKTFTEKICEWGECLNREVKFDFEDDAKDFLSRQMEPLPAEYQKDYPADYN